MNRVGGSDSEPSPGAPAATPSEDRQALLTALLARAARGHEDAFASLYDEVSDRVYGVALRVLQAPDHAAEVTQEVFVDIWRNSARYQPEKGSALGWILTMAHRRAVDRVRSVQRDTDRGQAYHDAAPDPETDRVWEAVTQRLDVDRVRQALNRITPVQREALTLTYFGGYSQSQVAELLGLPLGTTKSRIRDGLIGLRDALGVAI